MIIAILLWTIPAFIITYGLSFAYWQRKYPKLAKGDYCEDIRISVISALFASAIGPIGILVAVVLYAGYGFKIK